jgi:hypothetical protein
MFNTVARAWDYGQQECGFMVTVQPFSGTILQTVMCTGYWPSDDTSLNAHGF